jgi:hypothetical protein
VIKPKLPTRRDWIATALMVVGGCALGLALNGLHNALQDSHAAWFQQHGIERGINLRIALGLPSQEGQ